MQKKKIFYGWYIVAAGLCIIAAAGGLVGNCLGLFIVPVCEDLGFSRQAMAMNQTLISLGGMFVAALAGQIFKRFRLDRLMKLSAIVLTAAYCSFSFARSLPMFYAASVLISISMALLTWMPFSVILNNWFYERRGLAVGITFMGSGIGGMVFSALGGQLLDSFGWRTTILILSGIVAVMVIPTVFFVVRIHPREMHLEPYGQPPHADNAPVPVDESGATFGEALKSMRLYVIGISLIFIGIVNNGMVATVTPNLVDVGHSTTFAANITSVAMGALALGKLLLGILYDKLGTRKASMLALAAILCANAGMYFARHMFAMPMIVLGLGIGTGFCTVALPLVTRNVFGNRAFSTLTGIFTACNNLGSAIGPTLLGRICDMQGSYTPGYAIMVVTGVIFSVLLLLAMPGRKKV